MRCDGKCQTLMSDNDTNIVGANHELNRLHKLIHSTQLSRELVSEGTKWKHIPPSAQHFGGI